MSQKCLIVGYGKMGQIHAKHLDEFEVEWSFYDPSYPETEFNTDGFTHVIISCPTAFHYEMFRKLDNFYGKILIEKPVVLDREHLWVLRDHRVYPGMVERYNPATLSLNHYDKPFKELIFERHSVTGDMTDIGIHDIDLALWLLGYDKPVQVLRARHDFAHVAIGDVDVKFIWKRSGERIRSLVINNEDVVDFDKQLINGNPPILRGKQLEYKFPVRGELYNMLDEDCIPPDRELGYFSHKLLLDIHDQIEE